MNRPMPDWWTPEIADNLLVLARTRLPRSLSSTSDADDIVQETFRRALPHHDTLLSLEEGARRAYLRSIAGNVIHEQGRRHVRDGQLVQEPASDLGDAAAPHTTPSQAAIRNEEREAVEQAMEELPPRQREAVRQKHLEGRSAQEIAEEMETEAGRVHAMLQHGMKKLREQVGGKPRGKR